MGAVAAIGVFLWAHSADLGKPSALAAAFDPAPMRTYFAMGGEGLRCQVQGHRLDGRAGGEADRLRPASTTRCSPPIAAKTISSASWPMPCRRWVQNSSGITTRRGRNLQQRRAAGCQAGRGPARALLPDRPLLGGRPRPPLGDGAAEADDISLPRYLAYNDAAARSVTEAATPADRDRRLLDYFNVRKLIGRSHSSLLRRSRPAGCSGAVRRSRAPDRHCPAARAAHRSRLRIGAEPVWSGRNSSFSPQLRWTSSPAPPAATRAKEGLSEASNPLVRDEDPSGRLGLGPDRPPAP